MVVAAGPTGMVWVITWTGALLARTGVNWQNPTGKNTRTRVVLATQAGLWQDEVSQQPV